MAPKPTILIVVPSQISFYVGLNLQNILYGLELYLYFKTIYIFLARRKTPRELDTFYAIFSSVMFALVTIYIVVDIVYAARLWLLNQQNAGGTHRPAPYLDLAQTAGFIIQLMTDGLMVYRCRIVWDTLLVVIFPSFLFLGILVMGCYVTVVLAISPVNVLNAETVKLALANYALSVSLQVIMTGMISYRFLRYGKIVREYLGHEHAVQYYSIVVLLVESVLPTSLTGLLILISLLARSQAAVVLSRVYTLMMVVGPQMLILRVAEGFAWNRAIASRSSGSEESGMEFQVKSLPGHPPTESCKESV